MYLYISAISKDNMNIKINEPLFSTSRRYYTITLNVRVKHWDGWSELALIKPTFHVSSVFLTSIWNQLQQILQTNHSNSYQCRVQRASLITTGTQPKPFEVFL